MERRLEDRVKHWDNQYSNDRVNRTRISKKWQTIHNTVKLLENKLGENLDDLGYGDVFLDTAPKTQSVKVIVDKLDFIKIKNFCSEKDEIKRIRRQAID